ncbi:MAG: nitroreductase/quinone reductase family protein [Acidimicrobiia bacterium]
MIDAELRDHLAATMTIDLTTHGRRSGNPTRIEIWWFHVENRFIVTGTPGKRDWFANVITDNRVVVHTPRGDFAGTATVIEDADFRRRVFQHPKVGWYKTQSDLDDLVATAPMIEISF